MRKFRFGEFTLCSRNGLYKGREGVPLGPKELKVLEVLVRYSGKIVTKDDLVEQVWKGGIVSDESLCRCIYVLRKMFKQHAAQSYIRTVYGRGYQFFGDVVPIVAVHSNYVDAVVDFTAFSVHYTSAMYANNLSYSVKYNN